MDIRPKRALVIFSSITLVLIVQAAWWITFMAILLDEKVEMAKSLGADEKFVQIMHDEEISRQIMLGMEGIFFLLLVLVGAYLIYRSLVKTEELKFHQQNFLMAVTHELKTPLASIKIYLDTLQNEKIPAEKKLNVITHLQEDALRLEKLVQNILDAGRFERSGYQLKKDEFNLSVLLKESIQFIKTYPHSRELIVKTDNFEDNIIIYADRLALSRAIEAILENSIKYNDSEKMLIDVSLYRENKFVCINISDNGVGLTKKDSSKIFNRFYRVGEEINRSKPGSGLGLFLCREIIKAHDGAIVAESDGIGEGVEFKIKIKVVNNNENNSAG